MKVHRPTGLTRRKAVAAGAAALAAGLAAPARVRARGMLLRGVVGGGLLTIEGGQVNLGILASRMALTDPEENIFPGRIRWLEVGTGLSLESDEVTDCRTLEGREDGVQVRGWMSVNGAGRYPFLLTAIDAGPPGSGEDQLTLEVGPGAEVTEEGVTPEARAGFSYSAQGTLVTGDLQLLNIEGEIADAEG